MTDQDHTRVARRAAIRRMAAGALGLGVLGAAACRDPASETLAGPDGENGHLRARPGTPTKTVAAGVTPLGIGPTRGESRDGVLYVPASYDGSAAVPLVLLFHGATGNAAGVLPALQAQADARGFAILAPESRRSTWDLSYHAYDWDVAFVDLALAWAFDRVRVDPARVFAAGFSDGASYALSLGITNGDLFRGLVGFSPGYLDPAKPRGQPPVFMSHGLQDEVLPIDRCSRRIAVALRGEGYDVTYFEFDGGHTVPVGMREAAGSWMAQLTANG